jgi:hypothetical protein
MTGFFVPLCIFFFKTVFKKVKNAQGSLDFGPQIRGVENFSTPKTQSYQGFSAITSDLFLAKANNSKNPY